MGFDGKVCLITGGALGIGRCLVEQFALSGARVAFMDADAQAGQWLAHRMEQQGNAVLFVAGDVADEQALGWFADEAVARFGPVHCLINNACLTRRGILSGCTPEDFTYVLRVGVTAPYALTQLLLNHFAPGAAVVNLCSTRAFQSQADTESYTAAKGGIRALTHALAVSLAGRVRVNSISPGWIDTGAYRQPDYTAAYSEGDMAQHPAGRVGHPMDIVQAAMFLLDERNSFITGEDLTVDGGMSRRMIYHQDEGWSYHPERQ